VNKSKKVFLVIITFFMLIGLTTITATSIYNNDTTAFTYTTQTNTIDTTTQSDTPNSDTISTNEASSSQDNMQETSYSGETINNKSGEKTQNLKAPRIETVTNYDELNSTLTSNISDTVTINIGDDIQLAGNITVNEAITTLTINGNQKTIDGDGQYRFLKINHTSNTFINNLTIINCSAENGGAIEAFINSNITITDTTFTDNTATGSGGAIYGFSNKITLTGVNFTDNTAKFGAAIYANANNTLSITDTTFTDNKASHSGGALSVYSTNITITNTSLTDNTADQSGGAIFGATNNIITIIDTNLTNNKVNNKGGAISVSTSNVTIINTNIKNSTAKNEGGGIYGYSNNNITITDTNLTNNNAAYGGALYSSVNLTITKTIFTNNTATSNGGAIYGLGNIEITDSLYTNNSANNRGGVIWTSAGSNITITNTKITNNNATNQGGAIFGNMNSNITITNTEITNNNASSGGAIYGSTNINITITDNNITNNNAGTGGFVYAYGNITIINSNLTNNNANSNHGGAIYGYAGNITITNTNLINNNAKSQGGAIFSNNGNMTITNTNLTNNQVNTDGGAIYSNNANINNNITITNTTFRDNTANQSGGAICAHGINITITDTNFTNNNATSNGGAIYASTNSSVMISDANLSNNYANAGGAIYGSTNSSVMISDTNLSNNYASLGGAIYAITNNKLTLENSNITDNYVTSNNGYVVDFSNTNSVTITGNTFINNTDNARDMLFNNPKDGAEVDIHGNTYIDNFLEDTIIEPNVTKVTDNESRVYDYYVDVDLRSVYNDTVRNGTLNVYVNGVSTDTINVTSGRERIFFQNSALTNSENNITLEYITQSKHYQNTTTVVTVKKEINTTLSIQAPNNMTAGDTALINFTLVDVNNTPLSGETIHVLINEEEVAILTTENGVASYTFQALGNNTVTVEAKYPSSNDSIYQGAEDDAKINITKIQPEIVIMPGNITPYVESGISISLFEPGGTPIKNKTVLVNITEEGKPDITGTVTTDENGTAVFNFTPTDEGTINIAVTSPGDDIYHYESETVQARKNFITTNLLVTASDTTINQTNTITVEVLGGLLLSGTVELDINGVIHKLNITNGRGTYNDYKSDTAGEKNVTATFTSDNPSYANSTRTSEFNVDKLPTCVTIEAVNRTAGNVTLKVLVFPKDDIESIVDGGNIIIESVNGENRTVIYDGTLDNGELIYLTDVNETGLYNFETTYHGNDYFYGDVNNTGSIEVLPVNTNTTTFDKTAFVGDTIILNATVTDENGNPVNDGNVTFLIDGSQAYHTDGSPVEAVVKNGIATVEYTLPVTYMAGNHTITANYTGNNKYNTSSDDANLKIDLRDTNISVTPLNNTKGNTSIEITLNSPTEDNKPIPDAPIIVTLPDGTNVTGTTDENGTAIIPVDLPSGENNLTITYPGNETYKPQEEPTTINVTPRESKTTGTIANNTVGNVTVDVLVVDAETGEHITGQVNIIVADEIVGTGDLDAEGKATIPTDINVKGNYTIIVEYMENDDYYGSSDTLDDVNVVGKQADMNVSSDNPTVENTTLNVTLTDLESGEPIPDAPIIVTLPNGTKVNGTTDKYGNAIILVDLPGGENNLTITYPGNDEYEAQEENITLKVKSYSTVTVDLVEGLVLDNVTFTAHVVDYQGNPVTGGYAQFSVGGKTLKDEDGKNIRVLVENGTAKLSYKAESGWIVNTHPNLKVQVVYTGTSIVSANRSDTSKVTIYKRNATVTVSAPSDYVNGTLHIDAAVHDQNGSLINDGVLVFKLNGLTLKDENNKGIIAKVTNGTVHLDVKLPFAYSAKEYNLTAVYSNKAYNKVTGTNTTSLKAIPTYVNATVTIKDEYSKPVVKGQIYNKFNDAILEGTAVINIKFDGISYANKVKVNNGTFTETLEGIPIYKPGTHKVEVVSGDTYHYQSVRKTYTTKATKKYDVTTEFINITRNKTTTRVQARIVDMKNNNVQRNLTITIKLNGISFLVNRKVIDGNVDVLIDTSKLSNRNYTLELVSGANTYYNAGSATTELPKY